MTTYFSDVQTLEASEENSSSSNANKTNKKAYLIAKRVIDVLIASVALVLMLIPMALIILLIKLESPGPAIYVHNRIGKNGNPLGLFKFRSMFMNAEDMIRRGERHDS